MRRVFSLIVDNSSGVLSRVAGLFSRRGYQIVKQLRKLEDVRDIKVLEEGKSVFREIIMIKVKANASQRQDIAALCDIFRATIVDVAKDCLTVMLTGDNSKLEALSNLLSDYEVLELARTGLTALSRGSEDVVVLN